MLDRVTSKGGSRVFHKIRVAVRTKEISELGRVRLEQVSASVALWIGTFWID